MLECKKNLKDSYYYWLKRYGAYDFIDQIVGIEEKEVGYKIGFKKASLTIEKINPENLNIIIRTLNKFKNLNI